jgi:hypothetical protein
VVWCVCVCIEGGGWEGVVGRGHDYRGCYQCSYIERQVEHSCKIKQDL